MAEHNVVFTTLDAETPWSLDTYLAVDGYQAWKKILAEGAGAYLPHTARRVPRTNEAPIPSDNAGGQAMRGSKRIFAVALLGLLVAGGAPGALIRMAVIEPLSTAYEAPVSEPALEPVMLPLWRVTAPTFCVVPPMSRLPPDTVTGPEKALSRN